MQYDKYSDQLLALQERIPIAAALELLLDYPLHILEDINREYLNSGCTKRRDAAKNLARSAPDISEADYLRLLHASAALSLFKRWLNLKFYKGDIWFDPAEKYQTSILFDWINADKIIDRLEKEVDGFKAPGRAHQFIGYVRETVTTAAKTEPTQPEPESLPKDEPRTQKPTALPSESSPDANVFRKDGDYWTIIFNGKELPKIKDVKGLGYVQHALMKPGELIPNNQIEVVFGKPDEKIIDNSPESIGNNADDGITARENVNRTMTPEAYKVVSEELQRKEDELERKIKEGYQDTKELENEIEAIKKYLKQNTYRGKIKDFTDDETRASDRIRRAIQTAINNINNHDQTLAKFFKSSIKTSPTGTRYTPLPGTSPWEK